MAHHPGFDNRSSAAGVGNGTANGSTNGTGRTREPSTVAELAEAKQLPEAFLREQGLGDLPGGGIGITYYGEAGEELFVRRRGVPGAGKRFDQPKGTPLRPYGLHRLADLDGSPVLYLGEGETDTLTFWYASLPALGLPGSSSSKALEASHLAGVTDLWVCPDNDQGGKTFVEGLARRLGEIGYRGRAQVVHLPDGVKDVNELHRRSGARFRRDLEGLQRYASELDLGAGKSRNTAAARRLKLTGCDTVEMRPTEWLVPEFIPRGGLTVIAGDGGDGKSAITLHLAAMVSRGEPCFGLSYFAPPAAGVILAGCEDAADTTVVPRLLAAGADLRKVMLLDATVKL